MIPVKYVMFEGANTARIVEGIEMCEPEDNQVIIRAVKSLISPGTELAYFEGKHTDLQVGEIAFPMLAPGYSAVGIIEKMRNGESKFKEGDKVLAMMGDANKGMPSVNKLTAIPEELDFEQASCGVLGSIALHCMRKASIHRGECFTRT